MRCVRYVQIILCCLLAAICIVHTNVLASTANDFRVRTLVGDDVTSPTVPDPLSATPIATSQINLEWGTSTDDFLLGGYYVYRDGIQIATTTATQYEDTGLSPNTSYAYYVIAYDTFFNVSASSTVASATTLALPASSTTTGGTRYGFYLRSIKDELIRLEIYPERDLVTITFETHDYVRSVVRWGQTSSYEMGSIAEETFAKTHSTQITGLNPNTNYWFSIEGENKREEYGMLTKGSFLTLPPIDIYPPSNVTDLSAVQDGDSVRLSWNNPQDLDFSHVRVLRNDLFYPSDLADGWVVYEGSGEAMTDSGVFERYDRAYYTIFAYDDLGNVSSGAVVRVIRGGREGMGSVGTGTSPIPPEVAPPKDNPINVSLSDFVVIQDGISLSHVNGVFMIDGAKDFTLSIPYDRLPEHLKTILVTISYPEDPNLQFEFLLRSNPEQTAYTARIAPLGVRGVFPIRVAVFDYNTAQIGYMEGAIESNIFTTPYGEGSRSVLEEIFAFILRLMRGEGGYLVWFILLLVALVFGARRLFRANW